MFCSPYFFNCAKLCFSLITEYGRPSNGLCEKAPEMEGMGGARRPCLLLVLSALPWSRYHLIIKPIDDINCAVAVVFPDYKRATGSHNISQPRTEHHKPIS